MRAASLVWGVAFAAALAAPAPAAAQLTFPPVSSRDFDLDLYGQPALGSPRLIP